MSAAENKYTSDLELNKVDQLILMLGPKAGRKDTQLTDGSKP
jgi:hypothetical protein